MFKGSRSFVRPTDGSWSWIDEVAINGGFWKQTFPVNFQGLGPLTNNVASWINGARSLVASYCQGSTGSRTCAALEKHDEIQKSAHELLSDEVIQMVSKEDLSQAIATLPYGLRTRFAEETMYLADAIFSNAKKTWNTSYTSWGSFELDSRMPCSPKQLMDMTFGVRGLRPQIQNLVRNHQLLSGSLLQHDIGVQMEQRRGFKTYRRRTLMNSSAGDEGGGSKSFLRKTPDTTAGKMKLFSENERYDKLRNPSLSVVEQEKIKVAFAEGYLAAGDPNRAQSRAVRFLRAFQQILMITVFLALLFSLMGNVGPGMFRVSVGNGNEVMPEDITETFDDVKGVDEAKQELQDVVEFLRSPKRFVTLGGKLPKGVLLVGPPGTGKTLLARAVAGEAGVPFFHAAGPEFDEVLVGQGARRVRDLFRAAKARAPCVVFIDEIDSVGAKRTNSILHPYANQTINQLLAEMDGFVQNEGVIVLGATKKSRPERKSRIPDEETNKLTAFHEGGHALVAYYTKEAQTLHKVTIIPRGPSLGHQATSLAAHMVKEFGMSERVGLRFHDRQDGSLVVVNENSPSTSEAIDSEINRLLKESHGRATNILKEHRNELNLLADALLKYETLDVEDIKAIVEGKDIVAISGRHERHKSTPLPKQTTPFPSSRPANGAPLPTGEVVFAMAAPPPVVPQLWSASAKMSEKVRYATLYPAYINSNKKLCEGRRIAKEKCVPDPNVNEMKDVLLSAGFNVFLEPKIFPRERIKNPTYYGKVRVQIRNDDGTPFKSEIPNKNAVMEHLCEMIPKLKSRTQQRQGAQGGGAAPSGGATSGGGGGGAGGKKKKGRR
ncbi:unnamed protein product [Notodromas monacha]|uniref:AAA+ ATPase domain-containing protein n=1 Tax=Notodromas monacha TaxID=399045 RepID=A0A7R9BQJ3_9CRUS|nr:unnamed protein product [Notodromas monacha]CAG0918484.1 unnamed protein product [Notodromas monacha]